jgi:type II secretory pathway component PulJ
MRQETKCEKRRDGSLALRAFTVVELMVAISVMTLIVLVLYGLFDQTQRAMRGNVSQVDVLEGGRATMEMITRDFEELRASGVRSATNLFVQLTAAQTLQSLPGEGQLRISSLQECFFLTKPGRHWQQFGYVVVPERILNVAQPLGTLYRVALSNHVSNFTSNSLSGLYITNRDNMLAYGTNTLFQRVTDGVVHFRVRVLDARGIRHSPTNTVSTNMTIFMQLDPISNLATERELRYAFLEDALPAAVEVELGILDPQAVGRLRSMPNPTMAAEFLSRQSGRLHIFHQRIPIRTAR